MRWPILVVEVRAFARRTVHLCVALSALCGCAAFDAPYDPYTLYLTTPSPARVRTDYLDRYACANGAPLQCVCMSRLGSECDCRC